jgi:hypothetical protein
VRETTWLPSEADVRTAAGDAARVAHEAGPRLDGEKDLTES